MNDGGAVKEVVRYWFEKAADSLAAADDEMKAGRGAFTAKRTEIQKALRREGGFS